MNALAVFVSAVLLAHACLGAVPRKARDAICIAINADASNDDIKAQITAALEDVISNAANEQPDYGVPILDPFQLDTAGPYDVPGPLGTTVRMSVSDVTIEGLSQGVVQEVTVSGRGGSRQVSLTLSAPKLSFPNGNFVATRPIHLEGTFSGTAEDDVLTGSGDLSPGSLDNVKSSGSVDGNIDITTDPPSPLSEEGEKDLINQIAQDQILQLITKAVSLITKESCD